MPTYNAIRSHRNWWRTVRQPRATTDDYVPLVIRHGKDDEIGSLPYVVRLHAPQHVVAQAFMSPDHVEKAVSESRWITVHPNGEDQPGHPVMIKDNPDGTATIVGGIGGKLNGYRLSLVRSEDDYRQELASKDKREQSQMKAERDALVQAQAEEEYKKQEEDAKLDREQKRAKKLEAAENLARVVLSAQGIDPDAVLNVPDAVMATAKNPDQAQKFKEAHILGVAKHARAVANEVRSQVVTALEAQQPVEGVAFSDIVREALSGKTPGYSVNSQRIAVERGIVPSAEAVEGIRAESALLRADGDQELAAYRTAQVAKLQAGAAQARAAIKDALERSAQHGSGPHVLGSMDAKPVGIENAGAVLAAANAYRVASRSTPSAGTRSVAPVAFKPDIEGEDIPVQSIVDELRTRAVSKLVDMSNAQEAAGDSLYSHLSAGRYAKMAQVTAELIPGATIDPALVDFLGSDGAAQLIATAAMMSRTPEQIAGAQAKLVHDHLAQQASQSETAVGNASILLDKAGDDVHLDANSPETMIAAYAGIGERKALISKARELLGTARGKLEATASTIKAIDRVMQRPNDAVRVILPGSYKDTATLAAVLMPSLKLDEDYTIVSPKSGQMTLEISPQGVQKLVATSGVIPDENVSRRLDVIRSSANTTGKLPTGLRREIDAEGPAHGVAMTEYGQLTDKDRAIVRNYWAKTQGIDAAQECDPFGSLRPTQEPVWRKYQEARNEGMENQMMQSDLSGRFDGLAKLNLDDDREVVAFARTYSDILGIDAVKDPDGQIIAIPALDSRKGDARQARYARPRIVKFMRTLWANTQGADYFDPEAVKPVSQAWSKFVASSGGDMTAVGRVQEMMRADPEVMVMQGKPLSLTSSQERMVDMIVNNRRMAAGLGAGAGKTLVMMGSFSQLKNDGKANRALVAVPSAVVGQFESEWNKFVDPRYGTTIHAATGDGAKTTEALAGGADFVVMTHEGLRKRLLDACAQHMVSSPERTAERLKSMPQAEVDKVVHAAMDEQNWDFDYFAYDEGHKTLGRAGKEDSLLSILLDSASRKKTGDNQLPYYVFATADPAKNDVSELHSLLGKIDPERFTPESRDQFVRSYGRNTQDCAMALRNLMSPYIYTQPADVPVEQRRSDVMVPLTESEAHLHDSIQQAYQRARLGRAMGQPDLEAEKMLGATNPKALALARDNAISRALLWNAQGSKAQWVREKMHGERGRGTVIFARNRASVDALKQLLESDGHKVETLTGSDSGMSKRKKREAFQSEQHDVLICTDAAEAGMNLQRGNLMINFDVPMTAKTLEQRIARQVRMGQQRDVDVFNLVSNCQWDRRNLDRLKGKGALREIITSPFELSDDTGRVEDRVRSEAGV